MTTALAPVAVSQTSLTPVLTTEQKELQEQIGTPKTFWARTKELLAAGWAKLSGALQWGANLANSTREKLYQYIGSNPALLDQVMKQADVMLTQPDVQAKLKMIPQAVQKEVLHAAIAWTVKAPGAEEQWTAIKEKYGPAVTEAVLNVAVATVSVAAEAAWEAISERMSSKSAPVARPADGFSAR